MINPAFWPQMKVSARFAAAANKVTSPGLIGSGRIVPLSHQCIPSGEIWTRRSWCGQSARIYGEAVYKIDGFAGPGYLMRLNA